jgi:hypothetical protein
MSRAITLLPLWALGGLLYGELLFLCCMTFLCLVELLAIHYVLWQITEGVVSLQKITESKSLAIFSVSHRLDSWLF